MNPIQKSGYRKVLHDELQRRMERNNRYSIRGFARDLDVNPAQMVRILNGTRNLSLRMAKKISGQLFPDRAAQLSFISLVELETTSADIDMEKNAERIAAMAELIHEMHHLDVETMSKMVTWAHFAVLDLLGIKDPPREISSIAEYLGLEESVVQEIVNTLLESDLIEEGSEGLRKKYAFIACPDGIASSYIKEYHRQMMERAKNALETQGLDRRYFFGLTIGLAPSMYPELVEAAENFFRRIYEIARLSEKSAEKLYQVNLQVFDHKVDGKSL